MSLRFKVFFVFCLPGRVEYREAKPKFRRNSDDPINYHSQDWNISKENFHFTLIFRHDRFKANSYVIGKNMGDIQA